MKILICHSEGKFNTGKVFAVKGKEYQVIVDDPIRYVFRNEEGLEQTLLKDMNEVEEEDRWTNWFTFKEIPPFRIICTACGSEDVEVQKSISGVSFSCNSEICSQEAELEPEWDEQGHRYKWIEE